MHRQYCEATTIKDVTVGNGIRVLEPSFIKCKYKAVRVNDSSQIIEKSTWLDPDGNKIVIASHKQPFEHYSGPFSSWTLSIEESYTSTNVRVYIYWRLLQIIRLAAEAPYKTTPLILQTLLEDASPVLEAQKPPLRLQLDAVARSLFRNWIVEE